MCLAIPGKIKKIEGKRVYVQYPEEVREVLAGDEKVKVGNYVLVQMGIVIKILTSKEANLVLQT
jgi:hydrogenase assembly chaperone HypC/HupF